MSDPEFIMVSFPPVDNWGRLLINPFTPPPGYAFATSGPFVYPAPTSLDKGFAGRPK